MERYEHFLDCKLARVDNVPCQSRPISLASYIVWNRVPTVASQIHFHSVDVSSVAGSSLAGSSMGVGLFADLFADLFCRTSFPGSFPVG